MKSITKKSSLIFIIGALFFISACQPKVNCYSKNDYVQSMSDIAEYVGKYSPNDADAILLYSRNSSRYGDIDREICDLKAEAVRTYVRFIGKRKYPVGGRNSPISGEKKERIEKIQNSVSEAFGN